MRARAIEQSFPFTFILGLTAFVASTAASSMTQGVLLGNQPYIQTLRFVGIGWMAIGMTQWIALCRRMAGETSLNSLFMLVNTLAAILLTISLFVLPSTLIVIINRAGLLLAISAFCIGALVMLIDPKYPAHLATAWPDGGLAHPDPHVPAIDLHRPEYLTIEPDDLTRIHGIGRAIEQTLNQAGIITYRDLVRHDPTEIETLVRDSHIRAPISVQAWQQQARSLIQKQQT